MLCRVFIQNLNLILQFGNIMILVAIHTLKLEPYDYRPDIYFFVN